ncbi:hypothetical protein ODV97_17700 [Enterococcus gallinarum]|nr:hypothetical protein [Enterococcus gallinarum]
MAKKKYASATLAVESLDALSADLGEITAGIINGVEIKGDGLYSDYNYQIAEGSTVWRKGRLSMSGGYFRNDFQTYVKSTGKFKIMVSHNSAMKIFNLSYLTDRKKRKQIGIFL